LISRHKQRPLNAARYCDIIKKKLRRAIQNKKEEENDNARPHTARLTTDLLKSIWRVGTFRIVRLTVLTWHRVLTFHLFSKLKNALAVQRSITDEEVEEAVWNWARGVVGGRDLQEGYTKVGL